MYSAVNLESAQDKLEEIKTKWAKYPAAVKVWSNHFDQVEQLYDFPSDIRRNMYTTNAIESVNSSFRKVTKKGCFPNEESVYKVLYLRQKELSKKWTKPLRNWSLVRNQLMLDPRFSERMIKYDL